MMMSQIDIMCKHEDMWSGFGYFLAGGGVFPNIANTFHHVAPGGSPKHVERINHSRTFLTNANRDSAIASQNK